ncbi:hypothetical protein L2E74_23810 [Planktothrix agardhii 1026]|nr:hypothetical protein [Planktothrix agardhii 1026]
MHTYKFNEAVADKIVLDLRYEARDIDQNLTSETKIDQWFDAKTRGLSDLAKTQLKQKWGTMQKLLSSKRLTFILIKICKIMVYFKPFVALIVWMETIKNMAIS